MAACLFWGHWYEEKCKNSFIQNLNLICSVHFLWQQPIWHLYLFPMLKKKKKKKKKKRPSTSKKKRQWDQPRSLVWHKAKIMRVCHIVVLIFQVKEFLYLKKTQHLKFQNLCFIIFFYHDMNSNLKHWWESHLSHP